MKMLKHNSLHVQNNNKNSFGYPHVDDFLNYNVFFGIWVFIHNTFNTNFDYLGSNTQAKIFGLQWEINIFKNKLTRRDMKNL